MCFGCSKELSHGDGSFEYPQRMFLLRNKINNFQFWVLKRTAHGDGSFEYPQHMFLLKNKINNFQLHTLIWWPD